MKLHRSAALLGILLTALGAAAGCADLARGSTAKGNSSTEEDIADYEALRVQLESKRSVFLKGAAQDFTVAQNTLFWIDASAGNPFLKSRDGSGNTVSYGFKPYLVLPSAPNPIDNLNFAVSPSMVATMNVPDGANLYSAGMPNGAIAKITLPAPPFGQKWWLYAVSGNDLYVTVIVADKYHVQRWSGGKGQPATVAILDDLIAPNKVGELRGVAVDGTTLIFNEQGRVWLADLAEKKAKWIKNTKQTDHVSYDQNGAIYAEGNEFFRYDKNSDTRESLSDKINGGYAMNKTFAAAHHYTGGSWFGHKQEKVFYVGNSGLFRFDLASSKVTPLLLHARDNSIVYRYPVVLDDGTVYIKGLESKSGAIGADGPTFKLSP